MRNALPTGESPISAPAFTAPGMRFGPRMAPMVEPQTMSPIARPRSGPGVASAAA
jgi:hypothetical protein